MSQVAEGLMRGEHARTMRIIVHGRVAQDSQLRTAVAQVRERGHRVEVRVTWEPDDARVIYRQVPGLKIESSEQLQVNLDGEPVRADVFSFQTLPRHIPFYLPLTAPLGVTR